MINPLIQVNKPLSIRIVYINKFKRDYIRNINKLCYNARNSHCTQRIITSSQTSSFLFPTAKNISVCRALLQFQAHDLKTGLWQTKEGNEPFWCQNVLNLQGLMVLHESRFRGQTRAKVWRLVPWKLGWSAVDIFECRTTYFALQ